MKDNLEIQFKNRGTWVTKFVVSGKEYGGTYDALNDPRIEWFFQCFPKTETVLELGSLEGGHTLALANRPDVKRVVGIEGRQVNVDKALFIKNLYQNSKIQFIQADLERTNLAGLGQFDAVFCVGLLYHLPKPWEIIEQISRITKNLFLWTHYAGPNEQMVAAQSYRGIMYREFGIQDPLSGLSPESFWPTQESLSEMLRQYGFEYVWVIEANPIHVHGPAITLAATMHENSQFQRISLGQCAPSGTHPTRFFSWQLKSMLSWLLYRIR